MSAKKAAAAKIDTKQVEEAIAVGKETVEKAVAATKDQVEQAVAATKEQVEKASEAVTKGYEEMNSINKDTMAVVSKFGDVMMKGSEEMGKAYFTYLKAASEGQAEVAKALLAAKTVNEVVEIQTDYARTSFDSFVVESGKISELGVKVATDAFEPVQAHLNATVERMVKPLAA